MSCAPQGNCVQPPAGGRLAVVSGGGTGIGRASAAALLVAGCHLLLLGRRRQLLESAVAALGAEAGDRWVGSRVVDVSEPSDVAELASHLRATGRRVDVLVNNAGSPAASTHGDKGLAALSSSWLETYRANVVSAVLLTSGLEPLLTRPGGREVLLGSTAGLTGGASPAYVAAKAALHGWVLGLAGRLGRTASR